MVGSMSAIHWIAFGLAALWPAGAAAAPDASSPQWVQLGKVVAGASVTHEFTVRNDAVTTAKVARVQLTPPLIVTSMPAFVPAGGEGRIAVRMDTSGLRGNFTGEIDIIWEDDARPAVSFGIEATIVPIVEVSPAPVFFLAARRGESRHASLEIINHDAQALRIEEVTHSQERLTSSLDVLEEGSRYRLDLLLKPAGPGGRHTEPIVIRTSNPREPFITVVANTLLRERVYAFPEEVDFGTVSLSAIERDPGLLQGVAQTLMVYQFQGVDFTARMTTMLPQLEIVSARGPLKDRYQNTLTLKRDRLRVGPIRGSILIETNDPDFPELVVPVQGVVVP